MWTDDLVDPVDVKATVPTADINIQDMDFMQQLSYGDTSSDNWVQDLLDNDPLIPKTDVGVTPQQTTPTYGGSSTQGEGMLTKTQKNEGFVPHVYKDTEGYDTIGYGHKLTEEEKKSGKYANGISQEEAQKLYEQDEALHTAGLYKNAPWAKSLPDQAQEVLKDMAYNMGPGFIKEWPMFAKQLREGNYEAAAQNILNSKYAKQTKGRAIRNAEKLASI